MQFYFENSVQLGSLFVVYLLSVLNVGRGCLVKRRLLELKLFVSYFGSRNTNTTAWDTFVTCDKLDDYR